MDTSETFINMYEKAIESKPSAFKNFDRYFGLLDNWCANYKDNQPGAEYYRRFTSMEQLWLAFVMGAKYNKIWSGRNNKEIGYAC